MVYLYHPKASSPQLILEGDEHRYIFKVRRHKAGDILYLRNLEDAKLYRYEINSISKQAVFLELQDTQVLEVKAKKPLHIGWCMIEPKNVEKMLPSLNEIGVEKITFIQCKRSQSGFTVDFKRLEKILLNSSQQSGRSSMMQLETATSLEAFKAKYPQSCVVHFSDKKLSEVQNIDTIIVGCEGGFSQDELALFVPEKVIGLDTHLVLKSESAVCAVASKLLL